MFVNMLVRVGLLTCIACLLLAGCNKVQQASSETSGGRAGKAPTAPAAAPQTKPAGDAPPQVEESLFENSEPTEEQVMQTARRMLPILAPQYQCTVDFDADVLADDQNPQKTEKISEFTQRVAAQVIGTGEPVSDQLVSKVMSDALNVFATSESSGALQAEADVQGSGGLDDRETVERLKNGPVDVSAKLKVPERIRGNWRSIAEIKDSAVVNHDDEYYDLLTFSDREKGSYTSFRDGQQASHRPFTFTLETQKGKLLIRFEDGDAWTILLQQPQDNQYELRLTKLSEGLTTVFRSM